MLRRIVKRERLIVMLSALRGVACTHQRRSHQAMPDHERNCRALFLGERKELRRKLAQHVTVERQKVRDPKAVEDREQQQRVFGRLAKRFGLFDQQTCPPYGGLSFRRSISFDVHEWAYECDLKLNLLATKRRSGRQGGDLGQCTRELLYGFDQCRALQRPLSRLAPQVRSFPDQPSFGAVTCQQFRLVLGEVRELVFKGFGDTGVKRTSWLAQQRAVGRVLHKAKPTQQNSAGQIPSHVYWCAA